MYLLRTKKRATARKATTKMVTMAAMPPPVMPLDELDAGAALDAASVVEGVAVTGTALLVVEAAVGEEMVGVDDVETIEEDVDNGVSAEVDGRSVAVLSSDGSVVASGSDVAFGSDVASGWKAVSVNWSAEPSSVIVKNGSSEKMSAGKLSPF
jgi:hypothetical protein